MIISNGNEVIKKLLKFLSIIHDFYLSKSWVQTLLWVLTIIFWFVLIYLLNNYTYFTSDDFRYHFIYESYLPIEDNTKISNVFQIIPSMINHYNMWGGRIPAHTLVQFFLMLGKPMFNIINTVGYLCLAGLIYYHSIFKQKHSIILFNLILLMMWFFIPQFGLTILWVSGSGNYLWNMILILLFLLPYRIYCKKVKKSKDIVASIFMFFIGICAGWTNENTAGAMICLALLFILQSKLTKKALPKWSLVGLIGSIIGFILLLKAPGNYLRNTTDTISIIIFIKSLILFFMSSLKVLVPLFIIFGVLLIVYLNQVKDYQLINDISLYYLVASILATGAMILSPERPERTLFGSIIFLIIAVAVVFAKIEKTNCFQRISMFTNIMILGLFIIEYGYAYIDIKSTYEFVMTEHVEVIENEKNLGNMNIVLKKIPTSNSKYNAFNGTANLNLDSDSWFNEWLAEYFEVDKISGKED